MCIDNLQCFLDSSSVKFASSDEATACVLCRKKQQSVQCHTLQGNSTTQGEWRGIDGTALTDLKKPCIRKICFLYASTALREHVIVLQP